MQEGRRWEGVWGAPGALPPEGTVTWRVQGARTWSAHGEKLQLAQGSGDRMGYWSLLD